MNPPTAVCTFRFNDGAWTTPPVTSREPLLAMDTPIVAGRELTIKSGILSGATVEHLTAEVAYDDAKTKYHRGGTIQIEPPFFSTHLTWPTLVRNKQPVRYRVTVQEPSMVSEGERQSEDGPSITVGAEAHKVGRVRVQLLGPTLEAAGLDGMQVRFLPVAPGLSPGNPDEAMNLLFIRRGEQPDGRPHLAAQSAATVPVSVVQFPQRQPREQIRGGRTQGRHCWPCR